MSDKDKNAKKGSVEKTAVEATMETVKCSLAANWKVIVGILVLVIIVLNTFWNMTETKISETVAQAIGSISVAEEIESFKAELKSDLAKLDARVSETEKGTIDLDAVKADIASIKEAGEEFDKKLNAVIKAEEGKLALLEKDVVNQKAYIDELKGLLEGAVE